MDIKNFVSTLFSKGKTKGFDDMEVYFVDSEEFEVTSYEKEIDSYKINTEKGMSFRGKINGKLGYAFTEKFEDEDIDFLIENASRNAGQTEPDVEEEIFAGSESYSNFENTEFRDNDIPNKIKDAIDMEGYARDYDKRITSVQYCLVSTSKGARRIINTKGLDLSDSTGAAIGYISVVAGDGEDVKSGDKYKLSPDYNDVDFKKLVKDAADEAISMLGAKPVKSGAYKVILRNDAAVSLLSTFSSVFSADAAQKGFSLLKGKEEQKIASEKITLVDDPFYKGSLSSCTFDDEGVATYKKTVVEKGVLKTLLYNIKTAKKDGKTTTGNGFKASYKGTVSVAPTNFYIVPGTKSYNSAVKESDKALIITSLEGLHSGANAVSGDFSLAASGYLVENGKIKAPVEQITVAGNFYQVIDNVEEVLDDVFFGLPSGMGSYGSPSLVIKEMNISGE